MASMKRPQDLDHKNCSKEELLTELDELTTLINTLWPIYEHYYEVADDRGTRIVSSKVKSPFLFWLLNRFKNYIARILNQADQRAQIYAEELQRREHASKR